MKSVRERMDINAAYREVGTYRGAAGICGTTPKTVRRAVAAADAATARPGAGRGPQKGKCASEKVPAQAPALRFPEALQ